MYFEPEAAGDLRHRQVERFDVSVLEDKAADLREALRVKGWLEAPLSPDPIQ